MGGQYANKARDMFPDLDDWNNMAGEPTSAMRKFKILVDELLWKYTSVLMAQPFEVAKTILQVRLQDDVGALGAMASTPRPKLTSPRSSTYDQYADSDSDPDEPAYFTSNVPSTPTPGHVRHRARRTPSTSTDSPSQSSGPSLKPHQISLRRPDSVIDVISQLWQKEGAWGVWKGSNATFIYTVLQSLLENWSRSLLSAVFNVPDVGLSEDIDRLVGIAAPYPWASLFVAAAAAVATGLVLAPLDLVRTRYEHTSLLSYNTVTSHIYDVE
jgi:mitochondrial fusion and transport protein UGO1